MTGIPRIHLDRAVHQNDLDYLGGRAELIGPDDDTLGQAPAAVIGVQHYWDAERFAKFPDLKVLSRAGIGYDNVDVAAAEAAGVIVCNAPDSPTVSTAEHAVALMMAVTKELLPLKQRADQGLGGLADAGAASSLELDGTVLGLVGMGRIARRVATVGQAFGMEVVASDPFLDESPIAGVRLAPLDEVISQAHVLSLHAPSTPQTHHMMNTDSFASMRRGSYLINCARGPLVDHDALLHALNSGHLAAAGLDVTDPEPLPAGHPLLGRDDVLVTPHIASSTAIGRRRLYEHAFENALAVLEGRPASVVTSSS